MLVLGVNAALHDSSVALVGDEEVLFAAAEERFSRAKHDLSIPHRALAAALAHAGASLQDIDRVAFGWNRPGRAEAEDLRGMLTGHIPFGARSFAAQTALLARGVYRGGGKRVLARRAPTPAVRDARFIDHHEAHAWSAFGLSGFEEAAVLVVDGRGAWQSTSLYDGTPAVCAGWRRSATPTRLAPSTRASPSCWASSTATSGSSWASPPTGAPPWT